MEMKAQLDKTKLDYRFINAVNGKKLSDDELQEMVYDYPNCMLTKGEIGCALSHLSIYTTMVNEGIEQALVLEDDAILPENIENIISKIKLLNITDKPNIFLLSRIYSYIENQKLDDDIFKVYQAICSHAYIINLKAAKNLIKIQTPIKYESDMWRYFRYFNCANIYGYLSPIVSSNDEEKLTSSLEEERSPLLKAREKYRSKLRKTIKNYQYYRMKDMFLKKYYFNIKECGK